MAFLGSVSVAEAQIYQRTCAGGKPNNLLALPNGGSHVFNDYGYELMLVMMGEFVFHPFVNIFFQKLICLFFLPNLIIFPQTNKEKLIFIFNAISVKLNRSLKKGK